MPLPLFSSPNNCSVPSLEKSSASDALLLAVVIFTALLVLLLRWIKHASQGWLKELSIAAVIHRNNILVLTMSCNEHLEVSALFCVLLNWHCEDDLPWHCVDYATTSQLQYRYRQVTYCHALYYSISFNRLSSQRISCHTTEISSSVCLNGTCDRCGHR